MDRGAHAIPALTYVPPKLRVLGIDPGTHVVGFGVVEVRDGLLRHVSHGTVRPATGAPLEARLATIRHGLETVLRDQQPAIVAVEGLFFARNVRSALVLAHARGVALEVAAASGFPVAEYSPMEVKRGLVGYGRATKGQVARMVQRLLALASLPSNDAADALALSICHIHAARLGASRNRRGARR
jgi:crossover junction endodeoxyribonuclease RuvC